jgi:hypothetical protein
MRLQITALSISREAANRIGNPNATEITLDVGPTTAIRLSKDVLKLTELNNITDEGVLDTDLPFSPVNDAVFLEYRTLGSIDNRKNYYPVRVQIDGATIAFDRLLIRGRNETNQTWEVGFFRGEDHWITQANKYDIADIDYGTFELSQENLESNWDSPVYEGSYTNPTDQSPTYWPLIDYGGWVDLTPVPQGQTGRYKAVAPEDFRPLISLPYILRAGFCAIGWTLEGVILDTDYFRRLWVYALKQDYYTESKEGGRMVGRLFDRITNPQQYIIYANEIIAGLGSGFELDFAGVYLAGVKNNTGVQLVYRYLLNAEFSNETGAPFTALMAVWEMEDNLTGTTGEILSADIEQITIAAGETKRVIFSHDIIMKPGQSAAIQIWQVPASGWYIEPGAFISITPENKCLMRGDTPDIGNMVKRGTMLMQWLKAAMQLIGGGRLETDFLTKTITIHPEKTADVYGETVPGFLLESEPNTDIQADVIPDSIRAVPVRKDLKRYTRLLFANSSDAYIGSLSLTEPAHSRKILNGADLPDEVSEIQNPLFEPTLEGQPDRIGSGAAGRNPLPYIPRLWDNTDGNRSFNIGSRILYAFGNIRQVNPQPRTAAETYTTFFFDTPPNTAGTGLATTFGYATQLRTWELDPSPSTDGNVIFANADYNLFVSFYLGLTQAQRRGFSLDVLLRMTATQYNSYNFRSLYSFLYLGYPVRAEMQAIRDFDALSETATPVTFFVNPVETECCDLPCGCQFTTCEYYMDMGVYMRQATLDNLKVASFVVDGIEYITTPIGFGNVNIIDMGGQPYVMNLVDTLNSIGVPYFTFGTSNRSHYAKGKRFFKIKHPACIPFQITIEHSGSDVYLYTELEQKTQWFTPGTWSAIGYGTENYTDPIDCQTITEY